MARIEAEKQIPRFEMPRYSDRELADLDKLLEPYVVTKKVRTPREKMLKIHDTERFLIDQGALNKKGAVIVGREWPTLYEILTDKISQWMDWKSRQAFGAKRQLEDYQELANRMHISSSQVEES